MFRHEVCPECYSSHTEVIESRLCTNGTRRRRHACLHCTHRWTAWDGPRPKPAESAKKRRRKPQRHPVAPLTDAQVLQILMRTDTTNATMGRLMNRSPETIRQIRHGITHAKVHPEVARWGQTPAAPDKSAPSCYACTHWTDRCAFGFPDPLEEGPGFAADCDLYAA